MKQFIMFGLILSIYQSPSDKNMSVVECCYDAIASCDRLLVKNNQLQTKSVEQWVLKTCQKDN